MRLFALSSSIIIIALSGCQTSSSVSNGSSRSNDLPLTRTQATNYGIASSAGVEQLVSQALKHHPSLAAARQKIIRLQAKVPQAQALPDPKARISAGSLAQTAAGQVDAVAGVEQAIPFPGKRRAKANAAQKEADAAKAELENLKLRVAERVRFAFWDYYLAHQNQRISRESKEVLQTIQEIVQARVKANQGTQADLLRISTEISKVDQQLIAARQQTSSAKATLNALLNRPSHSSLPYPKRSSAPSSGNLNSLIANIGFAMQSSMPTLIF